MLTDQLMTFGLIVAVTLAALSFAAGYIAGDRRGHRHLQFTPQPRPVPPPMLCTLSGRPIQQCPPEHRHFPTRQPPEVAAQVAPTRLRPATVPAARKTLASRPQRGEGGRGRHWPVDTVHTQALPAVTPKATPS